MICAPPCGIPITPGGTVGSYTFPCQGIWLSKNVRSPVRFQTPRQKFPSCAEREEFITSVPSLCHTTTELSITTPPLTGTGSPFWVCAVKITCHMPTMDGSRWSSPSRAVLTSDGCTPPYSGCQLIGLIGLFGKP